MYNCKPCNYSTNKLTDMNRHNTSKLHSKKCAISNCKLSKQNEEHNETIKKLNEEIENLKKQVGFLTKELECANKLLSSEEKHSTVVGKQNLIFIDKNTYKYHLIYNKTIIIISI